MNDVSKNPVNITFSWSLLRLLVAGKNQLSQYRKIRKVSKREPSPSTMYARQSNNRLEKFGYFLLNEMRETHGFRYYQLVEIIGVDLYLEIQRSFKRFSTRKDTLQDNLNIIEAAHRVASIHPNRHEPNLYISCGVFGLCELLPSSFSQTSWIKFRTKASSALEVADCEDAKKVVSLLWHATSIQNKPPCMTEEELDVLVEQACALCEDIIQKHKSSNSSIESINAMRAIIKEDV